jgi:hypothetical protein
MSTVMAKVRVGYRLGGNRRIQATAILPEEGGLGVEAGVGVEVKAQAHFSIAVEYLPKMTYGDLGAEVDQEMKPLGAGTDQERKMGMVVAGPRTGSLHLIEGKHGGKVIAIRDNIATFGINEGQRMTFVIGSGMMMNRLTKDGRARAHLVHGEILTHSLTGLPKRSTDILHLPGAPPPAAQPTIALLPHPAHLEIRVVVEIMHHARFAGGVQITISVEQTLRGLWRGRNLQRIIVMGT